MSSIAGGAPSPVGVSGVLFKLVGANMNSVADQQFVKQGVFADYMITGILVTNASLSLTLAAGGVYSAAAKGGTAIVAAAQVYSALTAAALTLLATIANTNKRAETPYLALTVAQGAAATADLYIIGTALN